MQEESKPIYEEFMKFGVESTNKVMDYWFATLTNLSWAQEQVEKTINKAIEQGKVSREEGLTIIKEFMAKGKDNQQKFQEMVKDGVKSTIVAMQIPTKAQLDELRKQIDELSGRIKA